MYSNYYLIGRKRRIPEPISGDDNFSASQLDNRECNVIYSQNVSTFKRSQTLRSIVYLLFRQTKG